MPKASPRRRPSEPDLDLGPCCCCGRSARDARNIVMLPRLAPLPGTGWGCVVCGLPSDGAVYVCCDECLMSRVPPLEVVRGYTTAGGRAPIDSLAPQPFDHHLSRHGGELG